MTDVETKYRRAGQDDVEGLSGFLHAAWGEAGPGALGWTGASEETVSNIAGHEFLSALLEREDAQVFIALSEGRVVGFASCSKISSDAVELSGIVVLESMTGKGVGGRLLKLAADTAKEDGYRCMTVKTECFNDRAIGFYLGKGFKRTSVEEEVEGTRVKLVKLSLHL